MQYNQRLPRQSASGGLPRNDIKIMAELKIKNLCYLINSNGEILLQYKSRGFGLGKWNGPGGKVEKGENSVEAVIREIKEETGFDIINPEMMAELEFFYQDHEDWDNLTHVYLVRNYFGEMKIGDEGELRWFSPEEIPFDQMWDDDRHWLKEVLAGKYVKMKFYFNNQGELLNYENI